jgi:hypothetical protein
MKNQVQLILLSVLCLGTLSSRTQVPIYNSYPAVAPVIFLDFDGHTVSGTGWNIDGPIYCGASGLDSNQITEIFNRVAEDYRPFTINVTTDSTKYLSAPVNQRTRVVVTVTSDWYGAAGGVSFVNSFSWGDNTPCFVFSELLGYKPKSIAEAVSHEAGHTLGLRHQSTYDTSCVKISDYNTGVGTGEMSWAPIMGQGYSRNLTTWFNGPSSLGCTEFQDDLDVITSSVNGITYRSDYQPTSFNSALGETFTNNQFTANSIIVKNTDENMFKFSLPSLHAFQLSAIPFNVGSGNAGANLDIKVTLYNSLEGLLNSYSSSSTLSVIVDTILAPGTYYFKVQGVGNIYAPSYAILGSYSVQGTIIEPVPLRKIALSVASEKGKSLLTWTINTGDSIAEQTLEVSTDGKNFRPLAHPAYTDRSYSYKPVFSDNIIYRLHVRFDNNSNHYSNLVEIKETGENYKPKLVNSLVTNGVISITSPAVFDYAIFDMSGHILKKGKLSNGMNTISAASMIDGMYLIRFYDKNDQWTEKLVKQ